jgi:hypothetical protein
MASQGLVDVAQAASFFCFRAQRKQRYYHGDDQISSSFDNPVTFYHSRLLSKDRCS